LGRFRISLRGGCQIASRLCRVARVDRVNANLRGALYDLLGLSASRHGGQSSRLRRFGCRRRTGRRAEAVLERGNCFRLCLDLCLDRVKVGQATRQ
jgi:hypothetical protein